MTRQVSSKKEPCGRLPHPRSRSMTIVFVAAIAFVAGMSVAIVAMGLGMAAKGRLAGIVQRTGGRWGGLRGLPPLRCGCYNPASHRDSSWNRWLGRPLLCHAPAESA
jgi:hypothetical protein